MTDLELSQKVLDVVPTTMRFMRTATRKFQKDGLKFPHYRLIGYLDRHKVCSNRALSEWQGVSVAAMSRTIDGLVERGLLDRTPSPDDGRGVDLRLTPKGREVHQAYRAELRDYLKERLRKISDDDKRSLGAGLRVLGELFS